MCDTMAVRRSIFGEFRIHVSRVEVPPDSSKFTMSASFLSQPLDRDALFKNPSELR